MIRDRLRGTTAVEAMWSLAQETIALTTMVTSFVLLASQLGAKGYGAYVGLYGILAPLTAFTLSGVSLTVLEHTIREQEDPAMVVRSCATIAVAFGAGLTLLAIGLGHLLVGTIALPTMALLISAELIINSSTFAMISSIQARFGFIASVKVRMVGQVVRLVALIGLWALHELTLGTFAVAYFVSFTGYALWVGRVARHRGHVGRRFGAVERRHVHSTFLYALGIGAVVMQNDGDKTALNAYNYQTEAGVYGAAYRVVQMGLLPITALVVSTHVSFLDVDENANDQLGRAKKLAAISIVYAAVFSVGLILAAPLLPKIIDSSFDEAVDIIPWLVPLVILRGPGTFAMNGLLGLGRNKLRTTILVTNSLFAVGLYVSLIPHYSWKGAAVATVLSESTMFVAGWIALARCQRIWNRQHRPGYPVAAGLAPEVMT